MIPRRTTAATPEVGRAADPENPMKRRSPPSSRREAGFSFIEILVVMGIITVLVSMVVVVVPMIQEQGRRTKSRDNVRTIILYMSEGTTSVGDWPPYNGKNFVLSVIATNKLDRENTDNLAVLFSPGDGEYTLKAVDKKDYLAVTPEALKGEGHEEFLRLTSYAGRRNRDKGHKLTAKELERNALIICDDDDGPVHHAKGMVLGYSNANVKFATWSDLGISAPANDEDPKGLLGDEAPTTANGEELKHMSSGN
jgi:prepilin-type N-terminal cleavage/methylation domain-containing protein